MVDRIKAIAAAKGVSAAQLALAWILSQDEHIVPIPGTKRRTYLEENVASVNVTLSKVELAAIDAAFPWDAATGTRYPEAMMQLVGR